MSGRYTVQVPGVRRPPHIVHRRAGRPSHRPTESTNPSCSALASWESRCTSWPRRVSDSASSALYTFEPVPRSR